MTLAAGTKLGPYEILAPLGAGGMGEVYRARDERLKRDVAVKVLPTSLSSDPDRLKRFEQEAQAAGGLNHPNITAVYDVGQHDGAPYVVQELLEGETLRATLLRGPLPSRKAIDYASQIARGLAAAHEKGVVHRDLKPENLFLTRDGRAKILDFGLAKLIQPEQQEAGSPSVLPTQGESTEPGVVLGTLGYMSPEQVRGRPADARSDIFGFGCVLYEMLSGQRAFRGDTAADTMSAILTKEPPDLSDANEGFSPILNRVVHHCMEKSPDERFQSARDLAFALESSSAATGKTTPIEAPRRLTRLGLLLAAAVVCILAAALLFRPGARYEPPSFKQLTFRRGNLLQALYTPDGASIIYSAAWGSDSAEVFTARLDGTESHPFGLKNADVLAVSSKGEVAVLLAKKNLRHGGDSGTLGVVPLAGGTPRELLEDVFNAAWSADGTKLAVDRLVGGERLIEYPIGRVIYRTTNRLGLGIHFSGNGKRIAFFEETPQGPTLRVADLEGGVTTLVTLDRTEIDGGFQWGPGDRELVFATNSQQHEQSELRAVDLRHHVRTLYRGTGFYVLEDARPDGRLLLGQARVRFDIMFGSSDESAERNVDVPTDSFLADASPDGGTVLFQDGKGNAYLRRTDSPSLVRLGATWPNSLSPDGKWVVLFNLGGGHEISLVPTGPGEVKKLPLGDLVAFGGFVLRNGKSVLFSAPSGDGKTRRFYLVDIAGGSPRAISDPISESAIFLAESPDGAELATGAENGNSKIYRLAGGGAPRPIPGFKAGDQILEWSEDGKALYIGGGEAIPRRIERLDLETGRRDLWKSLMPPDPDGVYGIGLPSVTKDGRHWAYNVWRNSSYELWQVTGLEMR